MAESALDVDRDERWWSVYVKGIAMGSADVVPGVSGGTVAFITGIYGRLIRAIRSFDHVLFKHLINGRIRLACEHIDLPFLIALGAGIVTALAMFTRVLSLPLLIERHPVTIYAIFFGLILGSCVMLLGGSAMRRPTAWLALGLGVLFAIPILTAVPDQTPDTPLYIFIAGVFALSAMILPGISGSFVLLIFGKYVTVLTAIGALDLTVLVPFLAGGALGILCFARILAWLIGRYEIHMTFAITGLLLGSLWVIWPFQNRIYQTFGEKTKLVSSSPIWPSESSELFLALSLIAMAAIAVIALERLARGATDEHRRH